MHKILAIDDDLYILDIYRSIFKEAGFEVKTAEDASAAITVYQDFKPDLIVLDVDMPAGGGLKVFERLRSILMSTTPIVFSTGNPEKLGSEAKASGVTVVKKPFDKGVLVMAVRRILGLS